MNVNKASKQMPSTSLYNETWKKLIKKDDIRTALIVRLAGECGLCRIEIANLMVSNIDRHHNRGLWVELAKRIRGRYARQSKMRQREVPINSRLYGFLQQHVDTNQKYVIPRESGNYDKSFHPQHLNYFVAKKNNLPFTIHHLRHYFKTMVWQWMIRNKQPDIAVLKSFLGHTLTVHESYGKYTWDYKLELVDKSFATDQSSQYKEFGTSGLQDAIASGIVQGFTQAEIEKNRSFIVGWISKVMKHYTPSDLYEAMINDDILYISDNLGIQIMQYKEQFNRINANTFLQLIKENNLDLYSIIINTPGGVSWIHGQLENIKKQVVSYQ